MPFVGATLTTTCSADAKVRSVAPRELVWDTDVTTNVLEVKKLNWNVTMKLINVPPTCDGVSITTPCVSTDTADDPARARSRHSNSCTTPWVLSIAAHLPPWVLSIP